MELNEAEELVNELMHKHLSTARTRNWKFKWDNAISRFGSCAYRGTITMSKVLTSLNDETHVRDTILHEIAHALNYERHGRKILGKPHGKEWKAIAREIGCSDSRCYDKSVIRPTAKYTTICPNCERVGRADRKSNMAACGTCCKKHNNNKWHKDYVLTYIVNEKKPTDNLVD